MRPVIDEALEDDEGVELSLVNSMPFGGGNVAAVCNPVVTEDRPVL